MGKDSNKHLGHGPLQGGRYSVETSRKRVLLFQDNGIPEHIRAFAQDAVRFEIIINETGEILSLDDLVESVQVTWNQLNERSYKPSVELPTNWYCIRTLRISGTQIVHHVTFSSTKDAAELKDILWGYLESYFPDEKDANYQRESRSM